MPGTGGCSFAQRRGSPVRFAVRYVAPWYERYRTITLLRPVNAFAIRIAFSFASAPPSVKNVFSRSPGQSVASFWPRRARVS